jgi:opacity protein-like surface antigen
MNNFMENLDEFMRHKFNSEESGGAFEFREEYWEQAQALIELDEASRKKHRRWLLFWWVSALILLAGAWGLWETGSELFRSKNRQESAVEVATSNQSTTIPLVPNSTLSKNQNNSNSITEQAENASHSNVSHRNEGNTEKDAISIANQADNKRLNTHSVGTYNLLRKAEKAPAGTVLPIPTKNTDLENNAPVAINPGTKTVNRIIAATENPGKDAGSPASAPLNTTSADNGDTSDKQMGGSLSAFEPLSLPMQLLVNQSVVPTPLVKAEIMPPEPIKVLKDKQLRFGVETFASAFIFDQGAMRWGGGAGVFAERAFQKHWSATAAMRYRYVPKSDAIQSPDAESFTSQVRYSFGAQYIEQKRDITGFHLIELPIGVQWHAGRFALSAFGAPGIVLGALGKVTKSSFSSLSFAPDYNDAESDLYFSSDSYRRFSMSVGTGVEWEAFSGLSLCAQFQYFRGMTKPGLDGTKAKGFENISAGVKYRF